MKKVTILIPCYNEAKTIEEVVSRVVNSDISDKEIIIIDDYSNDGTKEILKNLSLYFSFLKLSLKNLISIKVIYI